MRRLLILLASLALGAGLWAAPVAAGPSSCGLVWGSLDESASGYARATVENVRVGRHACFDRMVVDLSGPAAGYHVGYVDQVTMDGSGLPVPLRGGAFLHVTVQAPAYDDAGNATFRPAQPGEVVNVAGYDTFRQLAWAGSFEGRTGFGLGVRARLPFRVLTLDHPARVVIDVAHHW
ncbi:hypothetical protein ACFXK0_14520 [Nocardia sp. NPDC059177]|uniref:AMIN-like domain-containing (lipo)protein n=1 Tax=Nocardia sp. NPDC059177 TaxID=3346759 RepID=UPI0036D00ED5